MKFLDYNNLKISRITLPFNGHDFNRDEKLNSTERIQKLMNIKSIIKKNK